MLPSFRLIAITFCCGFLVVFAGLRLAASVHGLHRAMPVMAAHAAPVPVGAIADRELRRGQSAVPVMYDMRFAVGSAVPASAGAQPVIDRAPSVMMPLVILPPIAMEAERSAPEANASVVAALAPQPAAKAEPPVSIDNPLPEPATIDLTLPPQAKVKAPSVAALTPGATARTVIDLPVPEPAPIDLSFAPAPAPKEKPAVATATPPTAPQAPSRAFDIPLPEPAPVDLTLPPEKPQTNLDPTGQKRAETDARSNAIEIAALATDVPPGTVRLPTKSIPLPRPKGTVQTAALQSAKPRPKPKPRRKATTKAQRNDFDLLFGSVAGNPQ